MCQRLQEMANAWEEYSRLEKCVEQLRMALQAHMNQSSTTPVRHTKHRQLSFYVCQRRGSNLSLCLVVQQQKVEMKRELWRIEDVTAGLSASKANYKVTIASVQNPGENCSRALMTQGPRVSKPSCLFTQRGS